MENRLWGQRRIPAELARLGFKVSARTLAKYMQRTHRRGPSTTWRSFLRQHGSEIWACDFFCVQTITFRTLYVFFVIHHTSRQVLHVHVTPHDRFVDGAANCRKLRLGPSTGSFPRS